ncbi:MAG: SRPBCC family protein [Pseudomonadales bacterium]
MAQTTIEQAFEAKAGCNALQARTAQRAELNGTRYTSAEVLEREWLNVWTKSWLFAGLLSDVNEPGDYFTYQVGRESVIVVCGDDSELRAFYNVCQHRGNRLLSGEAGCVGQFTCPYHGWSYSLDGALNKVPDAERFSPPVSLTDRSLKPVQLEQWAGMVWVNLDPDAQPLSDFLGPIIENLAPYHFENMVLTQHQTVALDANWKTVRDNFLEQYHVDFIHPQHASFVDCCNSTNILWPLGHSATMVEGFVTNSRYPLPEKTPEHLIPALKGLGLDPERYDGRVSDIRAAVQQRKRALSEEFKVDFSHLRDDQLTDVWQYDVFPNTFMTIQAEELWIYGPRPHPSDPNQCFFDKFTLQIPVEHGADSALGVTLSPGLSTSVNADRPNHDQFSGADVVAGNHSLTITIDQDIASLPDMQAGLHSRGFEHALLNEDEVRVQHFHDWLDEWMRD